MAGRYQHYLQQMIQKGFKRPDGGKRRPSVWVYTKDQAPYVRRIERFGGANEFYSPVSDGKSKTLDDKITEWEAHRQVDVRIWRNSQHNTPVEAVKAAELIGLTGIRTQAHRKSMQVVLEELLPKFGEILQDPDVLMSHIENHQAFKDNIHDQMIQFLDENGQNTPEVAASLEFKAVNRMINYAMSEVSGHALSKALRDVDRTFREAFDESDFNFSEQHKNVLEEQLDEKKIRADLLELNWFVLSGVSTSVSDLSLG